MFMNDICKDKTWSWRIRDIQKQFLSCYSLRYFNWQGVFNCVSNEEEGKEIQICLINSTINNSINLLHPVRVSYQQAFLKHIISTLEDKTLPVIDDIYEVYCHLMTLKNGATSFRHFIINNSAGKNVCVTIEESVYLISQGTTGLCCWQAAFALADFCLQNKAFFKDQIILELGSGVGFTGLALILSNITSKFFFSDCHASVLKLLCSNVSLNARNLGNENIEVNVVQDCENNSVLEHYNLLVTKFNKTKVHILNLPWEDISDRIIDILSPDIILAADVIYDESVFPALVSALKCCLSNKPMKAKAILACTVRNVNTVTSFIDLLMQQNFYIKVLDFDKSCNFYYDNSVEVRFYEVLYKVPGVSINEGH